MASGLLALTLVAYGPAFRADWVWDDDSYVTANPALRSTDGLRRIWLEPGAVAQYYPFTFTTLWIEYQLHGPAPAAYHATNVVLHAANAVLVGTALELLAVPAPWLVAALFAVHPLHVESVAWVTERKNVLSGCFGLVAFIALLRWRAAREAEEAHASRWYVVALTAFGAALLSKTVTSTLPIVFLVACWWRDGRVRRADLLGMLPLVALGIAAGSVTASLERTVAGAVGAYWNQTTAERVLIAGRALWFYAAKLAVPWPLIFVYPRWTLDAGSLAQWSAPITAALAGVGLFVTVPRLGRGPFAAALAFAVTLGPALGFVAVYPMRYSFVADHFVYLASVPFLALTVGVAGWLLPDGVRRPAAGVTIAVLGLLTWSRCTAFADAATLWRDTIAKNPAATIAYLNLGYDTYRAGRFEEAIALFDRGLAVEPDAADMWNDRGLAVGALGRTEEAVANFRRAAHADSTHVEARSNLGNALASLGRYAEAEAAYREALALRPGHAEAHNNLANVLALRGDASGALEHYQAAIAADPAYLDAHRNMGEVLLGAGRAVEACERFAAALRIAPRSLPSTLGRMRCLAASDRVSEAIAVGTDALHWAPTDAALRATLAKVLAQAGRPDEAEARRREAVAMDPSLAPAAP